ncbi:hypothetical protein AGMMS49921_00740 [Endomicrobiia bacterium]|nr:hypothetical protein AGMMS49921_00740 [Endomicrobiia bacterium]
MKIKYVSGQDYPKDISNYKIIIHCGGCTLNRKGMLARLNKATEAGVSITNYGIAISVFHDVIEKVLEVFAGSVESLQTSVEKSIKNLI